MATPTDIVNLALRRVGADRIGNLDTDSSNEARIARDIYDEARRNMLNESNWNFAIKRAQLTVSATAPTFGWDYAYPLPDDFVRLISVHPIDDDDSTVEYRLEFQSGDDRVLVTNATQVYVRYIFDCQDVNVWSATFRQAMGFKLASEFAGALSKSAAAMDLAEKNLRRQTIKARAIDGIEDFPETMPAGSWLTDRFTETDD